MDDSAATTVEDLVDEAAVVRVEWEVLSTTGNAGVFSELLGEDPTLEEMQVRSLPASRKGGGS